ncbi:nitrilase [Sporothrix schenckii 1099-18]|uniref:Nitrilase n=1 Tax=Sporothrix schenckii 1099-18 TaxID=1397361 RepID=A0A0F2M2W5_SPOSC|nr:nitrilase [Sporothrix schenckii 1099-18]KJR84042.1 nitrilase [Sporothrix schenckii 1099-18]
MTKIRLGTCSPTPADSPQASLALLETLAQRAATKGIDLLLLPEAFLGGGYPRGVRFGSTLGADNADGREAFLQYFQRAVDFGDVVGDAGAGGGDAWVNKTAADPEQATDKTKSTTAPGDGTRETLERIARETGVFLVVGAIERAGGSLYCAVVYVCPTQGVLGKRRKVQPPSKTGLERLIWSAAGPASLRAVTAHIKGVRVNLAAAICWENYMPLVRQSLYAQNVNLYLAPTADGSDAWLSLVRTIGIEGRCFVVTSNMTTKTGGSLAAAASVASAASSATTQLPTRQANGNTVTAPSTATATTNTSGGPPGSNSGINTKIVDYTSSSPMGKPRRRKKSFVYDEYGNEIVLSCETVAEEDVEPTTIVTNGIDSEEDASDENANGIHGLSSDAPVPLPPFPHLPVDKAWERHKHERRRSSVFDEDDNEIVLCRPPDSANTARAEQTIVDTAPEARPVFEPVFEPSPTTIPTRETGGQDTREKTKAQETAPNVPGTRGGSAIVSPFGEVLAGPQWDDADGIIAADVDFDDCIRGRLSLDVAGHYSRNDSFKLSVAGLDMSPLSY